MRIDRPALTRALGASVAFLQHQLFHGRCGLSCLGPDGTPRFPHNKGHIFVGSFVAEAIVSAMTELDRTLLLVRILSEENGGLWGFSPPAVFVSPEHRVFVVDADDTAYVLRTLRCLGVNRSPERLLTFYRPGARLFSTFDAEVDARLTIDASPDHNLLAHPEVNANVFLALAGTAFEQFINWDLVRDTQARDGHWPAYFYPSPFFGTYLFLTLIHGRPEFREQDARGTAFLARSQNSDGSWGVPADPYATALAAIALAMRDGVEGSLAAAAGYLLEAMDSRGACESNSAIWTFPESATDVWTATDPQGTLTTAVCALAIQRILAHAALRSML